MTRVQEVVGSNPYIWTFFTLICCRNDIVCLKKTENKQKETGFGPFKKTLMTIYPKITYNVMSSSDATIGTASKFIRKFITFILFYLGL